MVQPRSDWSDYQCRPCWRYNSLNFGTSSASEIFQKEIQSLLANIPGSLNISDDVIVFGHTQAEHDEALDAVCRKFSDVNLTLHKKKCEFNKPSISFFGFVFSGQGISPDPKKVEAIHNASPPTTNHQWWKKLLRDGHILRQIYP